MKVKIAAFKTDFSKFIVSDIPFEDRLPNGWVRLSEYVEIELTMIDSTKEQIESIDKKLKEEEGRHYAVKKQLEQEKQELLAITHKVE